MRLVLEIVAVVFCLALAVFGVTFLLNVVFDYTPKWAERAFRGAGAIMLLIGGGSLIAIIIVLVFHV